MEQHTSIIKKLDHINNKLVFYTSLYKTLRCLFASLLIVSLFILTAKFSPLTNNYIFLLASIIAVTIPVAIFAVNYFKSYPLINAALFVDKKLNSNEVVTQSYEITEKNVVSPYNKIILSKAEETLRQAQSSNLITLPKNSLPLKTLFTLFLALGLLFLPKIHIFSFNKKDETLKVPETTLKKLDEIYKNIEELAKKKNDIKLQHLAKQIHNLKKELEKGEIKREQAMARLDKVISQFKNFKIEAGDKNKVIKELSKNKNTEEFAKALKNRDSEKAQKESDKIANELSRSEGEDFTKEFSETLKKLKKETQGESLKDLLKGLSKDWENKDKEQTSHKLNELSDSLEDISYYDEKELDEDIENSISDLEDIEDTLAERSLETSFDEEEQFTKEEQEEMEKVKYTCSKCDKVHKEGEEECEGEGEGEGAGEGDIGTGLGKPKTGEPKEIETGDPKVITEKGKVNKGPLKRLKIFSAKTARPEKSNISLEDALPEYLDAVEKAINSDDVPPSHKDVVKKYFDRIKE